MKLSVIMPVYNEASTIGEIIRRVREVNLDKEIIVVDDFSTDGTRDLLREISGNDIRLFLHERNKGKGSGIRTALQHVRGEIVLIQDADLEYDPQDYYALVEPIEGRKADVVYGSRILGSHKRSSWLYWLGGRFLSWLTNLLYGTNITDEPTCYKVFKTDVLKSLGVEAKRFEFCPEVTAKLAKRGYRIYEIPISYEPRGVKEGKKIRWRDGLQAIWVLIKYRFFD